MQRVGPTRLWPFNEVKRKRHENDSSAFASDIHFWVNLEITSHLFVTFYKTTFSPAENGGKESHTAKLCIAASRYSEQRSAISCNVLWADKRIDALAAARSRGFREY